MHHIPGRVRFHICRLQADSEYATNLQEFLLTQPRIDRVRINRAAASIAIQYENRGLSDWELGVRLMNIINSVLGDKAGKSP